MCYAWSVTKPTTHAQVPCHSLSLRLWPSPGSSILLHSLGSPQTFNNHLLSKFILCTQEFCLHVSHVCLVSKDAKREHWVSQNCNYRWLSISSSNNLLDSSLKSRIRSGQWLCTQHYSHTAYLSLCCNILPINFPRLANVQAWLNHHVFRRQEYPWYSETSSHSEYLLVCDYIHIFMWLSD